MRPWILLAGLLAWSGLPGGCFRHVQEEVVTDSASYLSLEGGGGPVTLVLDGAVIADGVQPERGVRYKVARGTHEVQVLRRGQPVVQRRVYLGDGETRVLSVPGE